MLLKTSFKDRNLILSLDCGKSPVPRSLSAEEAAQIIGMKNAIFQVSSFIYGVDLVLTASLIEL